MRYAIISDVHANLEALDRVLKDAAAHGAEQVVCLGDVVGYGPRPAETVARIRETCAIVLAGNHDDAVSGRGDASTFIDLAGDAVVRHRAALSKEALGWLRSLPYTDTLDGAALSHGDLCDPPRFYYVEDEADATANFNATGERLVFVGHTHVPCLFLVGRSGTVYRTDPQDFTLEDGKRYIVNPGSVGYPREANGQCYSSYVLYDSAERTVCFRYLAFSVASVMQRGRAAGKLRRGILAGIVGATAALAAGLALLLTPGPRVPDEPEALPDTRAVCLSAGQRQVRANLTLAKDSVPVILRTTFKDAHGEQLAVETQTVKKSCAKTMKAPDGTALAEFDVFKVKPTDEPRMSAFAPDVR